MIQAVIFDIGNVLIGWQPEQFYDREIGSDRRHRLFSEVDLHEMNNRVDMGEDFTETIYATANAHPEWKDEIRIWHDRWVELTGPVIERSVRAMRALKAKGVPTPDKRVRSTSENPPSGPIRTAPGAVKSPVLVADTPARDSSA